MIIMFFGTTNLLAQSPSLEFASGGASTSATGPTVANQIVTFQRNANNPTANTFTTQTPLQTVTFSLANQQQTMVVSPGVGLMFGGGVTTSSSTPLSYAIYPTLAVFGGANNTHFRSWESTSTIGSEGMSTATNYSVELLSSTRPMYKNNSPLPSAGSPVSYQMADLTLNFNSPVSNPIIHFSGLGGAVGLGGSTPLSTEFVLISSGLSLTRLSGSTEFSVPSSTEIRNSAATFTGTTGAGGASGSVRVNGRNISSITFRVYLKAQLGPANNYWATGEDVHAGDGFLLSVSLSGIRRSGTVYRDNNGSGTIDNGGTGGGTWNTANTLYVNAISTTGIVLATAPVSNAGLFTIDSAGNFLVGDVVKFQLSKNQGVVGQPAPAKELPTGWATVGESFNSGTNDGTADGEFTVTLSAADLANNTTYRFGVTACNPGSLAPNFNDFENNAYRYFYYDVDDVASFSIKCGGGITADLSLLALRTAAPATPLPVGTTLTWHSATPATDANQLTDPLTAVTGATRNVYAAFRGGINCYSPTRKVTIYTPICATDDDYTATPITAGVGGTFPSVFANDTYSNVIISTLPPASVGFDYSVWVPSNANINFSTGVITVPSTVLPGIYKYSYKIVDKDTDGVYDSNASYASVIFRVVADSDGDGLHDEIDLDDDNDGILDTVESPSCYSCVLGTTNTWTSYQTFSTDATLLPPSVDESATFGNQNPETIIVTKFPHTDPFGFGIPWYNPMVLKATNNAFGVIDELSNTSAHSEWHVNMAIWQPPVVMANQPLRIRTNNNGFYGSPGGGRTEVSKLFAMVNDGTAPMRSANAGIDFNYNEVNLGNWNGTSCIILALYMFDQSLLHDNGVIEYWNGTIWTPLLTSSVSAMPAKTVGCTNDADGDGIPNHLDLDSDNDGCVDAIEGGENVTIAQLQTAIGTVSVGFGSSASNQNLGNTVNANGVPVIVNPGGAADTGSATAGTVGQPVGSSVNPLINPCCTNPPNLNPATDFTKTGISTLEGFAGGTTGWPGNVPNGFIAIESQNKGFVITRVVSANNIPVADRVEGMLVYDITDSCVKLYNGSYWKCLEKDCGIPTN